MEAEEGRGDNDSGEILGVGEGVAQGDEPALGVADEEERPPGVFLPHQTVSGSNICEELAEAIHVNAWARALSVPPVVEGPAVEAPPGEVVHHVAVPPRVLGEAVDEEQDRCRLSLGRPALPVEADPVGVRDPALVVLHHASSRRSLRTCATARFHPV